MKFRFSVRRLELPNNQNVLACAGTTSKMMDVAVNLFVNGVKVWESTDLENFGNSIPPPVTVGSLSVTTTTENSEEVAVVEIAGLEIWESAQLDIEVSKTGYNTYVNSFTIFGYDLGNSPTINNANGDPIDYNPNVIITLIPATAGSTRATATYLGDWLMYAVTYGSAANGLFIVGNGTDDFDTLIAAFNSANPNNLVQGNALYDAVVPPNGAVYTLSGGIDVTYNYPYASITGWSAPFTNKQYYYNMSSSRGQAVFLNSDNVQVGLGKFAVVCCSTLPVKIKVTTYDHCNCGCGAPEVVGECTSEEVLAPVYYLKPTYYASIACQSCCETPENCIIVQGDNEVLVSIDTALLSTMFVDDDDVIGTGTVELTYELYNSAGLVVSSGGFEYDYSTGILPDWEVTIPEYGNYILLFKVGIEGVFVCQTAYKYVGCNQYHITQTNCNTFRVYNYSASKTQLRVHKLNGDKQFTLVQTISVEACSYVDVIANQDGVYNFNIGVLDENNLIVVVDCNLRACYLDFLNKLACSGVSKCTCGGKCASGCSAIPFDFYNFNAFMALVYAYFSLLNEEYVEHYIYNGIVGDETDFSKDDIERFYNIHQLLERALEYCSVCKDVKDNTGCITCK